MEVPLRNGLVALVDDEDYEKVAGLPWTTDDQGYVHAWVGNARLLVHRVVLGAKADEFSDHRFHEKRDNRKQSLRIATKQQNARNRLKVKKLTSSRFKGVCWFKPTGCWQARISVSRTRRICLGYFSNEVTAAKAYNEAALKHFGEFASLNRI